MRLHSEYVQAQMRSLAEQASEMGQIVSRAAMDAAKPKMLTAAPKSDAMRLQRLISTAILSRNVRPAGACHAALQLKLRCVAQN